MSDTRQIQPTGIPPPPQPSYPASASFPGRPTFPPSRWTDYPAGQRPVYPSPATPPSAPYFAFDHHAQPVLQGPFQSPFQPRSLGFAKPPQQFFDQPRQQLGGSFPQQREIDPWYNPVMVARQRTPPKKRATKRTEGKQPSFMSKLYGILEQEQYRYIIRWDDAGEVIIIERPDELASKILPLVYRQSRFASFSRQLNIYGWMRKVSLRHLERGIVDPDASTWYHPYLRRDSPKEDILSFKRRVPPRPSQAQKQLSRLHSDDLSPSSESDHSFQSPSDAYHRHVFADHDNARHEAWHQTEPPQLVRTCLSPVSAESPSPVEMEHVEMEEEKESTVWDAPAPSRSGLPSNMGFSPEHPLIFRSGEGFPIQTTPAFPQSAPPNTGSFPASDYLIVRDHFRTRSVQGEPPSATLQSPTSPLEIWTKQALPTPSGNSGVTSAAMPEQLATPTFKPNDATTWARRGYGQLSVGIVPQYSATTYSAPQPSVYYQSSEGDQSANSYLSVYQPGMPFSNPAPTTMQNTTFPTPMTAGPPHQPAVKTERHDAFSTRAARLQDGSVHRRSTEVMGTTGGEGFLGHQGGSARLTAGFSGDSDDAEPVDTQQSL